MITPLKPTAPAWNCRFDIAPAMPALLMINAPLPWLNVATAALPAFKLNCTFDAPTLNWPAPGVSNAKLPPTDRLIVPPNMKLAAPETDR